MLDQLTGDCETREERLRKLMDEQEKAHSMRPPPKRSSPAPPRNEGLNDIQTRQVEEMIALSRNDLQNSIEAKDASPATIRSKEESLSPRLPTRSHDNGPDKELHFRARGRFIEHKKDQEKMKAALTTNLGEHLRRAMQMKRVRVDGKDQRFEEDKDLKHKCTYAGEVRKYAHDLKSYQQTLNTGEHAQQEFSVTGLKTGSDFYPRGSSGTTGIPAGPYYAVQTLAGGHRDSSGSGERALPRTAATGEKPQTGNMTMPKIRNTSRGHLRHARDLINQQSSRIMAQPKRLSTGLSYVTSHEARPVRRIAALQGQIAGSLFEVQSMATPHTTVQQMESLHMNEMFEYQDQNYNTHTSQLPQQPSKDQPLAVLFEDMRMAKAELRSQIRHKTPGKQGLPARMHL